MSKHFKFGTILEWSSARWMVIRHTGLDIDGKGRDPDGYDAIWLGHDKPTHPPSHVREVGSISGIAVRYTDKSISVVTDDE